MVRVANSALGTLLQMVSDLATAFFNARDRAAGWRQQWYTPLSAAVHGHLACDYGVMQQFLEGARI